MTNLDTEGVSYIRLILAFAVVSGLMGLLALALRLLAKKGLVLPGRAPLKSSQLKVVEGITIVGGKRLVVVRWHQKDHLLVLGADHATLISSEPVLESSPQIASSPTP